MSASNIEWTDTTWQVTNGCSMVSPGCHHCYAEVMSNRLAGMAKADTAAGRNPGRKSHYLNVINGKGRWNGKIELVPEALTDPFGWRAPRRVFVNSMSDLFHDDVPFEYVDRVFAVMALTPRHTYQILTKRPERMWDYFDKHATRHKWGAAASVFTGKLDGAQGNCDSAICNCVYPLPNVWLGTSVEDQARADERIPHLLRCPAAVRFLSVEPLLGPVDLSQWLPNKQSRYFLARCEACGYVGTSERWGVDGGEDSDLYCPKCQSVKCTVLDEKDGLGWGIIGGESGRGARPLNVEWIRSIVRQCKAAGVACFVKQLGKRPFREDLHTPIDGKQPGKRIVELKTIDSKGGDMSEWAEDLRVREFPKVMAV